MNTGFQLVEKGEVRSIQGPNRVRYVAQGHFDRLTAGNSDQGSPLSAEPRPAPGYHLLISNPFLQINSHASGMATEADGLQVHSNMLTAGA